MIMGDLYPDFRTGREVGKGVLNRFDIEVGKLVFPLFENFRDVIAGHRGGGAETVIYHLTKKVEYGVLSTVSIGEAEGAGSVDPIAGVRDRAFRERELGDELADGAGRMTEVILIAQEANLGAESCKYAFKDGKNHAMSGGRVLFKEDHELGDSF